MNGEEVRASGLVLGKIIDILATDDSPTVTATLVCSGKTIECRKSVLQIASDVFMAMLTAPMKEKTTGVVEMDDVNGDMMQRVVDFYETGLLPDVSDILHEDLQYIITKYNFVGIKEAVADKILKGASDSKLLKEESHSGEPDLHDCVIAFYGNHVQKELALHQVTNLLACDDKYPDCVLNLNSADFVKLLRISLRHLRSIVGQPKENSSESETCAAVKILSIFREWLKKDPDSRSESFIAVVNLIDMRGLDFDFFIKEVLTLPLKKEYQVLLGLLKASLQFTDERAKKMNREIFCSDCYLRGMESKLLCQSCKHEAVPPYHTTSGCAGYHQCPRGNFLLRFNFVPNICQEKVFASLSPPMDMI